MVYARHPDPDLRERAYRSCTACYGADGPILGQMYQTLVRDWRNEEVGLRHFSTPISARNLANDIPDEVVDTLLDVCQANAPLFQRYFRLKARWLGMERLRRYDIYAPVVSIREVLFLRGGSRDGVRFLSGIRPAVCRDWPSASSETTTWTARCAKASAAALSARR